MLQSGIRGRNAAGKWFSDKVSSGLASSLLGGASLPLMKRSELVRRDFVSSWRGKLFAQPPPASAYADEIIINGTSFKETAVGSLRYVSATNQMVTMDAGD